MNQQGNSTKLPTGPGRHLLPAALIVVVLVGYFAFIRLSVMPRLRTRQELVSTLAAAKEELRIAEATQQQRPAQVSAQVATAQVVLGDTLGNFLSEAQATDLLARLYQYAGESGVEIQSLQALPTPQAQPQAQPTWPPPTPTPPLPAASPTQAGTEAKDAAMASPQPQPTSTPQPSPLPVEPRQLYGSRSFLLQARGGMPNLLYFVSRVKEATLSNCAISNVSIVEAEGRHTLTMDITLYTSPHAAGFGAYSGSTATGGSAPTLLPSLSASVRPGLVRPTNWPTNEPWPPDMGTPPPATNTPLPSAPTLTATMTLPAPSPGPTVVQYTEYIVRYGDTLFSLARRYGTTVSAIQAANGLTSDRIQAGQRLRIPKP